MLPPTPVPGFGQATALPLNSRWSKWALAIILASQSVTRPDNRYRDLYGMVLHPFISRDDGVAQVKVQKKRRKKRRISLAFILVRSIVILSFFVYPALLMPLVTAALQSGWTSAVFSHVFKSNPACFRSLLADLFETKFWSPSGTNSLSHLPIKRNLRNAAIQRTCPSHVSCVMLDSQEACVLSLRFVVVESCFLQSCQYSIIGRETYTFQNPNPKYFLYPEGNSVCKWAPVN